MHFVDEVCLQILTHGRYTAADANVFASCSVLRPSERFMDSVRHEMKRRVALHREGGTRVVRQHEYGRVKRRIVTPPALPRLVLPGAAYRAEHVAAHDPSANVLETTFGELVIGVLRAAGFAEHLLERTCMKEPVVDSFAADPERRLETLLRPGTKAVIEMANARTFTLDMLHSPQVRIGRLRAARGYLAPCCRHAKHAKDQSVLAKPTSLPLTGEFCA